MIDDQDCPFCGTDPEYFCVRHARPEPIDLSPETIEAMLSDDNGTPRTSEVSPEDMCSAGRCMLRRGEGRMFCSAHEAENRGLRSGEAPMSVLSDRLIASMAKGADEYPLPLRLVSRRGQTAIVHDENGVCVLDTTTPGKPCDFDCFVVDAVNCVPALAREVQWFRAQRRESAQPAPTECTSCHAALTKESGWRFEGGSVVCLDSAACVRRASPNASAVVWANEATPFDGPQAKALLDENERLRTALAATAAHLGIGFEPATDDAEMLYMVPEQTDNVLQALRRAATGVSPSSIPALDTSTWAVDYGALDPGIRNLVRWLVSNGFATTDSGDGISKRPATIDNPDGDACAESEPNVYMLVDLDKLVSEADRLLALLGNVSDLLPQIQASYDPLDKTGIIALHGIDDKSGQFTSPARKEKKT